MEQVRAVDQQALGGGERVAVRGGHRRHRTRPTGRAGYDRAVSLLLLVDLDGVVYRGADPVPGVAAVLADRAARGDDVVYVTNNSMHYRADYQTRLAAMGAPVTPEHRRLVARGRRRSTCATTTRRSGGCSSSAPAASSASCATWATTW